MLQNCEQWRRERIYRLTASNVHTILKKQDNFVDFAASLLANSRKDFSAVLPVRLGKLREPMVKNILRNKFSKHIFRNTGLVVHPLFPFIGASPDGLLYHPDNPMIVEIKCIYNPSRQSLIQLSDKRKDFCLEFSKDKGNFVLKTTHSYYTQIQMQLFCTNLDTCLFALFYDFKQPLFLEVIHIDQAFCKNALSLLSKFYFQYYLPELVSRDI
uniref:YqaJ viral recombinase domain-containing protein n=1 Tax=Biomphalaria glabrata TaxID=6526 RepID=A0A2C9KJD1_BIOGL